MCNKVWSMKCNVSCEYQYLFVIVRSSFIEMVPESKQLFASTFTELIQVKRKTVMKLSFVMQMLSDTLFAGKLCLKNR